MPRLIRTTSRRGYTLTELIMTVTLLAIVGTVVTRTMMGQQRFYQYQAEKINVRRELRTAMSLLPADLRGLSSSGGDLISLTADSITFRNQLGGSIVCRKPTNTQLELPPLNMSNNVLTSWYTPPAVGDSLFAFNEGMLRGAEDDTWTPLRITLVEQSTTYCPGSVFIGAADAAKPRFRVTVASPIPDSVKIGAGVRFVRSTRYLLTMSASSKWYLSRSELVGGGWTPATPVSGPYEAPSAGATTGMRFEYYDSLGTAVSGAANSRRVARIDLKLLAKGASSSKAIVGSSTTNQDSLAFRIALRNRQ